MTACAAPHQVVATGHAAARARERFGVQAAPADFRQTMLDIQDSVIGLRRAATLLRAQSDGKEVWLARLCGVAMAIVYDPRTATIVTILPDGRKSRRRC